MTVPFFAWSDLMTESTYWILTTDERSSSTNLLKNAYSSEPLKCLIMSVQSGGLSHWPRLGFKLPLKIFNALDLPIPFVPTNPSTSPGLGVGSLWILNWLFPYQCVTSLSSPEGKLIMLIALKGHFLIHCPHPIHKISEMKATLEVLLTSIHSFPAFTTGQ